MDIEKPISTLVYDSILESLVKSIMRAQVELVRAWKFGINLADIPDQKLNKHFSWLIWEFPEGANRHFNDPTGNQKPLRVAGLRNQKAAPKHVSERLNSRLSPYEEEDNEINNETRNKFARDGTTRISSLIKHAFSNGLDAAELAQDKVSAFSVSPLAIALEFLTVPNMPGTRAYALFSIRNFLFSQYKLIPDLYGEESAHKSFTIKDVETNLSTIWTSFRPRYESKGHDKLPPGREESIAGLIRAYLAMKGVLYLYFRNNEKCVDFFSSDTLLTSKPKNSKKYDFEYSKSPYMEKIPEAAEIVNELFGLPVPLRGGSTIFRGGLKFSARQGLVVALHGGPGTGKTSLALGLCAALAPFGIETLFLTAEETKADLSVRVGSMVSDEIRRLSFFPNDVGSTIHFQKFVISHGDGESALRSLETDISLLADRLEGRDPHDQTLLGTTDEKIFYIPKPCRLIVVLDGLHDLFATITGTDQYKVSHTHKISLLYSLIERFKGLKALVILTSGKEWEGNPSLDYQVDVAIRLSHHAIDEYGAKPDRHMLLSKARHQLCATGIHGIQIAGSKGVRFSPQINYQLDKRSAWKTRLPDENFIKHVLRRVASHESLKSLLQNSAPNAWKKFRFDENGQSASIFRGSHIFLNGTGSGGKAALALKIAMAPSFPPENAKNANCDETILRQEKILIVSFLYPDQYYQHILNELHRRLAIEYDKINVPKSRITVFQLYPGHLKPNDLYNRIEWELNAAELYGDPYTCIIIDGIHNVFLQFPAIENYGLFWPQLYSSLRTRPITMITTHTTLSVPVEDVNAPRIDDLRSEPLRHALVQKTDFQFEVNPWQSSNPVNGDNLVGVFTVKTLAAIGQPLPRGHVLWSREHMILFEALSSSSPLCS